MAGDRLPPDMTFHDSGEEFQFTRQLPDTLLRCGPVQGLSATPPRGITWVGGTSRQTRVGSELAFNATVAVTDEGEALRAVQAEVLPRYSRP